MRQLMELVKRHLPQRMHYVIFWRSSNIHKSVRAHDAVIDGSYVRLLRRGRTVALLPLETVVSIVRSDAASPDGP